MGNGRGAVVSTCMPEGPRRPLHEVRQTVHLERMRAALTILEGETLLWLAVPIEVGEAVA